MISKVRAGLILSLFLISLGGFLLHLRVHPLTIEVEEVIKKSADGLPSSPQMEVTSMVKKVNYKNTIPFIAGLLSMTVVILLFSFKSTASYAYLINGMFVIIGIITMAHFSISKMNFPVSLGSLTLFTTFPDIAILLGKFFVSKAIYDSYFVSADTVLQADIK